MDDAAASAADQVAKLIKEALSTISSFSTGGKHGGTTERRVDLVFPDGIGDINVELIAPGGVTIKLDIASSAKKRNVDEGDQGTITINSSVHPMHVTLEGTSRIYGRFSETAIGPQSAAILLNPGKNDIVATIP